MGLAAAAGACGLLLGIGAAHATPLSLTITDSNLNGGASFTLTDSMTSGSSALGTWVISAGSISFLGADSTNVSTATSFPSSGTATSPNMDLNVIYSPMGTISLSATDAGFIGQGTTIFDTSVGGTLSTSDSANFSSSSSLGSLACLPSCGNSYPAGAFSGYELNQQILALNSSYSLTLNASLNNTTKGASSFDLNIATVPEPGTLALFGAGLLGCALFIGRRRRSLQDRA